MGWANASIEHANDENETTRLENITIEMHSWIASMVPLGCTLGVIPFSYCNQQFGPKRTMLIQSPFYIFIWILLASITKTSIYLAGRFFCGFISISYRICGDTLLVDSVHRGYLKHMIIFQRCSTFLGVLITYLMGFELHKTVTTAVCALVTIIHTFLLFFARDSPVFLYGVNPAKAEEALAWYRGPQNAYAEMRKIRQDAELRNVDPAATSAMLYAKVVVKAILIVTGVMFFQIFSGYMVFLFYSIEAWHNTGEYFDPLTESAVYGICMLLFNFLAGCLHYRLYFGVRKPLLVSSSFVALQLAVVSAYMYIRDHNKELIISKLPWLPLVHVTFFLLFYEIGYSLLPDILLYDYLPHQVYRRAKYIVTAFWWFWVFILVKFFPSVTEASSDYVAFGILAGISLIGVFYIAVFVIESKNKSLVEIQLEIGGNPIGSRGKYRQRIIDL